MIYLDTHVVVWLFAGRFDKLTGKVTELINKNEIAVSPIVRLELQYLFEIQRITVHANEIVTDLSDRIGLKICSKDLASFIHKFTLFSKACIINLNADVETGNSKLGNASTSLCFPQFQISNFKFHCQNTRSTKCKLLLTCREGCQRF